jgi:NhaP-type Na+/H+ and K+/H+ antiporter
LLNVESGLNDGLALPLVVTILAMADQKQLQYGSLIGEVMLGVGLGVLVPWIAVTLERVPIFKSHVTYAPLHAFAIGLLVLGLSSRTHANEFLAAFAAGITVATVAPAVRDAFHHFGELLAELRRMTQGYAAPGWACATLRALYQGLADLEAAMHLHVHLENNVLFPRVLALLET